MRLTDTTMGELETLMARSVQRGIADAVNDETVERFWAAGLTVLQRNAARHTGRFVLGGLWALLSKVWLFVLLGGIVYALGGWPALTALAKSLFGSGGAS